MERPPRPRIPWVVRYLTVCLVLVVAHGALAAIPTCVTQDRWIEVRAGQVILLSNAGEEAARTYAQQLAWESEALALRGRSFGGDAGVVRAYALADPTCFAPFRLTKGGRPLDSDGYFLQSPTGGVLAFHAGLNGDEAHVVYHEFVHAAIAHQAVHIPTCMNEGLAEYFSTFSPGDRMVAYGHDLPAHRAWLLSHDLLDIDRLFAIDVGSPEYLGGDDQHTFYAESWAVIEYLNRTLDDGGRFDEFFARLENGDAPRAAFEASYPDESWESLPAHARAYVDAGRMVVQELQLGHDLSPVRETVRAVEPHEVDTLLGELAIGADPGGSLAAELFAAARAAAPEDGRALAGQGVIAEQGGDADGALRLYRSALALSPDDPRVAYLAARAAMRHATARESVIEAIPAELVEARGWLGRALRASPGDPGLVRLLTGSFHGWPLSPSDVEQLARAYRITTTGSERVAGLRHALEDAGEWQLSHDVGVAMEGDAGTALPVAGPLVVELAAADRAMLQNRFDVADSLARHVVSHTEDPVLRQRAQSTLGAVAVQRRWAGTYASYNAGVRAMRERRWADARARFDEARSASVDTSLVRKATQAIEQIDRALARTGGH